jgi:hypothetical protein
MARIDHALATWPSAEEGGVDRDRRAAETVAKAAAGAGAEGDEPDLLAPPLPARPGEGPERGRSRVWAVAGGAAVAVAAMAAGIGAIQLKSADDAQGVSASAAGSAASASLSMGGSAGPRPAGAAWKTVHPASANPIDVPGVDPASLPQARDDRAPALRPVPAVRPASPARAQAGVADPVDPATARDPAAADDTLRPAGGVAPGAGIVSDPSSVPRRPSFGAAQAALATVLPAARACLQSSDDACRVTVTFQSNGAVRDVGLPESVDPQAAACLRGTLSKASLPPFAEPTFAAPVTVRAAPR